MPPSLGAVPQDNRCDVEAWGRLGLEEPRQIRKFVNVCHVNVSHVCHRDVENL